MLARAIARYDRGFAAQLGVRFRAWEPDRVVLGMEIVARHLNIAGVTHGGMLATLLDIAGCAAGAYCPYPRCVRRVLTLSMTTTHAAQGGPG